MRVPRLFAAIACLGLPPRVLPGWDDRVGSLAPGKLADVIAVRGDSLGSLEALSEVPFVMKGGVVYKGPDAVRWSDMAGGR